MSDLNETPATEVFSANNRRNNQRNNQDDELAAAGAFAAEAFAAEAGAAAPELALPELELPELLESEPDDAEEPPSDPLDLPGMLAVDFDALESVL